MSDDMDERTKPRPLKVQEQGPVISRIPRLSKEEDHTLLKTSRVPRKWATKDALCFEAEKLAAPQ